MVAKGLTYKQIAERLVVSHRTVQNHVQNTLGKLQMHNRVELTRYAIEQGLDEADKPGQGATERPAWRSLDAQIETSDRLREDARWPEQLVDDRGDEPLNILILGTDSTEGPDLRPAVTTTGLSDTSILLHVSADRRSATGSIPRELVVDRPECRSKDGTPDAPRG